MTSKNLMNFDYRPEIDGLRGIAVLLVVAYHFQINLFLGGFIGVDIFFVISGYLITSIIQTELENSDKFSFKNFYIRRIRRLAPAFLIMILCSLPIAYFTLMPALLIEYSKSILHAVIFVSNLFFYNSEIEYGLEDGLFQPILHSWSLSIEEQFYIFFPLIFFIIYKFKKKYILFFILTVSVFSISLSIYYLNHPNLVFYSIQFRIWELLFGAGLGFIKFNGVKLNLKKIFLSILRVLSLLLIFLSLYLGYHKIFFPFNVIPAVAGTGILILICNKNDFIGKILSSKVFVAAGLISYSLYIWHFPILAFNTISELNINQGILFATSLLIAFISYQLIERPFRNENIINLKYLIIFISTILTIIILFIYLVFKSDGFKDRYFIEKINLDNLAYIAERDKVALSLGYPEFDNFTDNKDNNILIIGNSFGQDLFYSLKLNQELFIDYEFSFLRTQIYCLKDFVKTKSLCEEKTTKLQTMKISNADVLILSSRWKEKDLEHINSILNQLKTLNKKIVVVSPSPEFDIKWKYAGKKIYGIITMLDDFLIEKMKFPSKEEIIELEKKYYNYWITDKKHFKNTLFLKNIAIRNGVGFLNQSKYYCDLENKLCNVLTVHGEKIFYDYGHRTIKGAKYFGEKIYNQNWLKF